MRSTLSKSATLVFIVGVSVGLIVSDKIVAKLSGVEIDDWVSVVVPVVVVSVLVVEAAVLLEESLDEVQPLLKSAITKAAINNFIFFKSKYFIFRPLIREFKFKPSLS